MGFGSLEALLWRRITVLGSERRLTKEPGWPQSFLLRDTTLHQTPEAKRIKGWVLDFPPPKLS